MGRCVLVRPPVGRSSPDAPVPPPCARPPCLTT
jgi:hypothetical protein